VAVEMITIYRNDYNTHAYFKSFNEEERRAFDAEYTRLLTEYKLP